MGFLRNKKEEFDEEIVEGEEEFKVKPLRRKTKEKKKKEIRPWTTRDRKILLIIIVTTVLISGMLALSSRDWKLPGLPRVSMSAIKFPGFSSEPIVLEAPKSEFSEIAGKSKTIISDFEASTKNLSGVYGFYVVDLASGYSFGMYEDETFQAASLIKLPVIASMYLEAENEKLNLEEKYSLKASDKVAGSGSLQTKPAEFKITYRELINLMGKESDNTAYKISKDYLGEEKINENLIGFDMRSTELSRNETTPKDVGTFFKSLWEGNLVKLAYKEAILDSLTDTIYENHLVKGIPGLRVAHKYGREVHVINDAGIVYAEKPYVVVIMSKGVIEKEGDKVFPLLSKIIFEGLTN